MKVSVVDVILGFSGVGVVVGWVVEEGYMCGSVGDIEWVGVGLGVGFRV